MQDGSRRTSKLIATGGQAVQEPANGDDRLVKPQENLRNVRLVVTCDPDYVAFMRRMADRRPSGGGPRAAGELLGGMVEQAVRHWLSATVPLQPERILAWEQTQRSGRVGTLYREIDGVWQIDDESLCLFEMKLTHAENMEGGVGLAQLGRSTQILLASGRLRYILQRLVYVAEEPVPVLNGEIPSLEPVNEYDAVGVIWAPPAAVEKAAQELGLLLPADWLAPEAREGFVEDPERDEWRQFSDTSARQRGVEEVTDGPFADALRRAMER